MMPKKGEPLSEEQKAKMAEGRRRAAEQKAAEAAEAERAAAVQAEQDKVAADRHTAPAMTQTIQPDPTPVQYGGQQEWGPFDSFQEVHTPYGLYGLPAWTIMHFEPYVAKLPNTDETIDSHRPIYRKVAKPRV